MELTSDARSCKSLNVKVKSLEEIFPDSSPPEYLTEGLGDHQVPSQPAAQRPSSGPVAEAEFVSKIGK